jgi:hypothetical protein
LTSCFITCACTSGFSVGYVSWFRSYINNRQYSVRVSGTLSSPFQVNSGVPQCSVLGPFFSTYSLMTCRFLIIAYLRIYRVFSFRHDCLLLQSDINSMSDWGGANSVRFNIIKRVFCHTPGRQIFWVTSISFAMLPL